MQSSSTERPMIYRSDCTCDSHYDKQLVERNYDLIIDKLFDLMFGTNEFVRTYRKAQRFYGLLENIFQKSNKNSFFFR
jgi:hypothetical protein